MNKGSQFESIGAYVPEKIVSTKELVSVLPESAVKKLELLTGIRERRVCSNQDDSVSLAVSAANECLKHSRYDASEIEMVISCSITKYYGGLKHYFDPAIALYIKEAIGAKNAICFDISNACAGMLTGVYIADSYLRSGLIKNCLVVSGEYISSLTKNDIRGIRTIASKGIASLTLGDAGAAVIMDIPDDDNFSLSLDNFVTLVKYNKLCVGKQSQKGPGATMKTDIKAIHEASIKNSYPLMRNSLEKLGLNITDFDFLIPHQTSRSAIRSGSQYFKDKLNSEPGSIIVNVEEFGNTASTTHFLALYKKLNENVFKINDRIMLICMASGLVLGILVFKMNNMISRYGNNN
ncbi:MAG: 3-oxoacyl-[acyl-carrier-protein] synthase III C-terminal domain-containing protein [Bacteroidales bacterium]|nr:3-oxoacyl-[acyl-carrier-protein] synthase III C-terminal domain-containing protein [Bacteroidales bacterium]